MGHKILMIDDEPLALSGYRRLLEDYFEIRTAVSAVDGLRLMENEGPFAAVVVDYHMPEVDGVAFSVKARVLAPWTVRIMLTGKGDLGVVTEALNRGNIFFYLNKPCTKNRLLEAIVAAVEHYRKGDSSGILDNAERFEGLLHFYRGCRYFDRGRYSQAAVQFIKAKQVFQKAKLFRDELRSGLCLAGALAVGSDDCPDAGDLAGLISEVLDLHQPEDGAAYHPVEGAYVRPALRWALKHRIEVARLAALEEEGKAGFDLLRVDALGPLQMSSGLLSFEVNAWRNPKVKMLFLYLLTCRRKKIERDIILETFWPGMDTCQGANNFSTTLHSLRQKVGTATVSYSKGLCWLEKKAFWCDADDFEAFAGQGCLKALEGQKAEAKSLFERAAALYRGDYLEEYVYQDWIISERVRLKELYGEMLGRWAELLAAENDFLAAAGVLERLPFDDDYDDRHLFQLIHYYMQAGKKGLALKRYNHYRSIMLEELGLEPSREIWELLKFNPRSATVQGAGN